jgi:hypothetical protein
MLSLDRDGRVYLIKEMAEWEADPGIYWTGSDTHAVLKLVDGGRYDAMCAAIERDVT